MICSRCKKRPAVVFITRQEGDKSINEGICIQCAKELGIKPVEDMMQRMGITDEMLSGMDEQLMNFMNEAGMGGNEEGEEDGDSFEPGGTAAFPFGEKYSAEDGDAGKDGAKDKKKKSKEEKRRFLDQYCVNITAKAKNGKLDRIIGRSEETFRVIQILNRRSKNNPCLIGDPGVGKTAIAEGLALKIASGDVPPKLRSKEIYLLDLAALVAGTQFRGQFESRIKGLIDEVKKLGNIILFIDEVHSLVSAGDAEGSMNAANIMKPALSRGEIQVIGATTMTEYRKYIEKDSALERRFQPVTVNEPSVGDTMEILKGIKHYYENYHKVRIDDGLLYQMVLLSERYITDRYLPDKAIDLLDEACSNLSLTDMLCTSLEEKTIELEDVMTKQELLTDDGTDEYYQKVTQLSGEKSRLEKEIAALKLQPACLTLEHIARVIELWTGIPATKIKEDEFSRLAKLGDRLKERIVGQDEAVAAVVAAITRSRIGISPKRKPVSFIFVGPTGVGKTELVKVLAADLFDAPESLIRLDMSEFMEKHSVSRIIGAPPGYVGYDEAGQLTEKIRRKPYSVILFDEIEKAHPDVLNILLQILDDGRVTDAHGKTVNFENTVIIMTSNAGSEKKSGIVGFNTSETAVVKEKAMNALRDFLRPEFINRVDEIVAFAPLAMETLISIAKIMIGDLQKNLEEKGFKLTVNEEVYAKIADKGESALYGARNLRRIIQKEIEDAIATLVVGSYEKHYMDFTASVEDGAIVVRPTEK
ncbi:MAG: ATP-dependent Clp protease ATP-binding subunit [Ruminococcaceae bacterium]|nr:ATP-dependent Clp protease ATP-binding subunit [Oscillospiraceae bacterium]